MNAGLAVHQSVGSGLEVYHSVGSGLAIYLDVRSRCGFRVRELPAQGLVARKTPPIAQSATPLLLDNSGIDIETPLIINQVQGNLLHRIMLITRSRANV